MRFKKSFRVSMLAFAAFALAACPNAQDRAANLTQALSVEKQNYAGLRSFSFSRGQQVTLSREDKAKRGPHVYENLKDWSNAVDAIEWQIDGIVAHLNKKPDQAASVQEMLKQLQTALDELLSRSVDYTLVIPSWQKSEADVAARNIEQSMNVIRSYYAALFKATAPVASFSVSVIQDPDMISGKVACLDLFETIDNSKYAGTNDLGWCYRAAQVNCNHRVQENCLKQAVKRFAKYECYDEVEPADPQANIYKTESEWMSQAIVGCTSAEDLYRK